MSFTAVYISQYKECQVNNLHEMESHVQFLKVHARAAGSVGLMQATQSVPVPLEPRTNSR